MRLSRRAFCALVERAIADLPPQFAPYLEELTVDVEDVPCPTRIIVTTPTASFNNFLKPLTAVIEQYAKPIQERLHWVKDPAQFIATYIKAFRKSFLAVQQDYLDQRQAYHGLFSDSPCDGRGNFPDRWLSVLGRLEQTDVDDLEARIRACFPQPVTPIGP